VIGKEADVHVDVKVDSCVRARLDDALFACHVNYWARQRLGIACLKVTGGALVGKIGDDECGTLDFLLDASDQILEGMFFVDADCNAAEFSDDRFDRLKSLVVLPIDPLFLLTPLFFTLNRYHNEYAGLVFPEELLSAMLKGAIRYRLLSTTGKACNRVEGHVVVFPRG